MTAFRTKASVILLLLCGIIVPIIQVGVVNSAQPDQFSGSRSRPTLPPNPSGTFSRAQPTIALPTARPTVSVSFTRTVATSFSYVSTAWTGISFTRTIQTSYTINPTFIMTTTTTYPQYWYAGMGFFHYGTGYVASTGAFTLGQTLSDQYNNPCLYYTYFLFNAPAGQTITARLWTTGSPVHVIIVPVTVLDKFESPTSCSSLAQSAVNLLSQIQTFASTPYILTWTAPQDGQYAIVFFSKSFYGNTVYFLPQ